MLHDCHDLILLFNTLFRDTEETILISGKAEPFYQPKNPDCQLNQLFFRQDYYSSALHEIAHWCIAGKERRTLPDFGYWYQPDGRLPSEQKLFEQVEAKPQAIEWIFSIAAGSKFYVSADNLSGDTNVTENFKRHIYQYAIHYLNHSLPKNAETFKNGLLDFYQRHNSFDKTLFLYPTL